MALETGTRLGPYEIISTLGAGGMGEVYRARDTRLGRHVAIKVLLPGASGDTGSSERFEREARTVSALSHPNICPLFDVGEQDGQSFLVMECLEGETLAMTLRRNAPPIDRCFTMAAQVADGLAHAHAAGVIHRDLKPGNVMVLPDGSIKILDFGLARKLVGATDATMANLTETGIISGTVAYMSPEQTLGERVDHRSDIFSLGVVIYEMLCGKRPFDGPTAFAVMQKVVSYDPPPLDAMRRGVPPDGARFIERMMAKSADHRPASAAEIAATLRQQAAMAPSTGSWPVDASAPTMTIAGAGLPARRAARTRWTVGVAVALVLLGLLLVVPAWRAQIVNRVPPLFGRVGGPPGEAAAAVTLPQNAADWTRLGRAYLRRYDQKGNIDRAIEAFTKAAELDSSNAAAYAGLSESYRQKDSLTPDAQLVRQAIESGQRAITLTPDLASAHAALGLALLRAKQPEEGRKEIEKAIDLEPTNLSALIGLGEYYISKGDAPQAERIYRRALQAAPSEWVPAQLLGRSLYAQARYPEAAAVWEQANSQTPDNVQILRNLGAVYHMIDRTDEAVSALQGALAIEPSATIYSNLGTLRFFQGRYSDAAAAYEKAVELNATFFLYWANLGDAYRWVPGSAEKARQAYSRAVSLIEDRVRATPADPDLQTQLAVFLAKQGEAARASQAIQQWQTLTKKTPASHFRALLTHELVGARDAALAELDAALRAGYSQKEIQNEPELAKLRSDPRYHRIVAAFETAPPR